MYNYSFIIRFILIAIFCLVITLIATGCDSEETITESYLDTIEVIVTDTILAPKIFIGYVSLSPHLTGSVSAISLGDYSNLLDSVKFGDSTATITNNFSGHPQTNANYSNLADSTRYSSGDAVEIRLFSTFGEGICNVQLLDNDRDSVILIDSLTQDTITVGQSFDITWNKVSVAQWYAVQLYIGWDSSGIFVTNDYVLEATDTTLTIDDSFAKGEGWIGITVIPLTGPMSTADQGNITGDIKGSIHSYGRIDYRTFYVVPPAGRSSHRYNPDHNPEPIETILNKLFKQ